MFCELLTDLGIGADDLVELSVALTPRSSAPSGGNSERLEFLGDAVLSVIVSDHLYGIFPDADEGFLTKTRAAVIREESLADAARSLGYGAMLKLSRSSELAGVRDWDSALADCFEAVLAAVYLASGYAKARDFALRALALQMDGAIAGTSTTDHKTTLQEILQARGGVAPSYRIVFDEGPDHSKVFTAEVYHEGVTLGVGQGRTKQKAEQRAAGHALNGERWSAE